jgi:hypothetical protein
LESLLGYRAEAKISCSMEKRHRCTVSKNSVEMQDLKALLKATGLLNMLDINGARQQY